MATSGSVDLGANTGSGGGGGGGVTSVNGLSGALTLAAGSNITLTPSGNTITIASTGGGGTPGGINHQLQYNNAGSFGGDTAVTDGSGNLSATSIALSNLTASRAVVSDGSKFLISSATTLAELAFVSGVTSSIQTQLNSKQAGPLTGDVTTSGAAATLATVNSNVGSFALANVTVNAKGLVTAASAASTTGSGAVVLATSPVLVTPNLDTPSAINLANATNLPLSANTPLMQQYFGDGSDGNVTISSSITLARDTYYNNLTIATGASLKPGGYRIFVLGILDITSAPAGAVVASGGNGAAGQAAGSGGAGGAQAAVGGGALPTVPNPTTGGNGGVTTGVAAGGNLQSYVLGGGAVGGGNGGTGSTGNTGGGGSGTTHVTGAITYRRWTDNVISRNTTGLAQATYASQTPRAGGGGGGNGTNSGGGGGGSGGPPGPIWISAFTINRGGGTAAGVFQAIGGNGGAGGTPVAASCAGGGGGSGSGGGWVWIAYNSLTGSTATNCIDVSGGAGGNGGTSVTGAGTPATGGGSGDSGAVTLVNLGAGTASYTGPVNGVSGSAGSGLTGGAGAAINTSQVSI